MAKTYDSYEYYNWGSHENGEYKLTSSAKSHILNFLKSSTYYSDDVLESKSDIVLYRMYKNIQESITKYKKEIKEKLTEQPELIKQIGESTYNNLDNLTYNELSNIREKLGLSKKGKKKYSVQRQNIQGTIKSNETKQEEYHQFTLDEFFSNEVEQVVVNVRRLKPITVEQGFKIFGDEFAYMSTKKLEEHNYEVVGDPEEIEYAIRLHIELRQKLIDYISFADYTSYDGEYYSEERLYKMSLEELKYVYSYGFQKVEYTYPTVEAVEDEIRLSFKNKNGEE